MGIVEASLHAFDILQAQSIDFRAGSQACWRTLNRLFPAAARTDDPWQDLLVAGGRTPHSRDRPWTWDSTVRPSYGGGAATA